MPTTVPALCGRPETQLRAQQIPPPVSLRTATLFINSTARSHAVLSLRTLHPYLRAGNRVLSAIGRLPMDRQPATGRIVPPLLDRRLRQATSRAEAATIAEDEFDRRENAAALLNEERGKYALRADFQILFGGFGISAHALPPFAIEGFVDAAVRLLPGSRWQFGLINLGDVTRRLHEHAIEITAEAVAALGIGGARFCGMFGSAEHTPFCPCAQQNEAGEGLAIGMSSPGHLLEAIRNRPPSASEEDAILHAQILALTGADSVGRELALRLGVHYWGCDPSQAPVFDADSPRSNSIGAVIEEISGVKFGLPGTKGAFFRLMDALQRAGAASNVPLCGFLNGSFLPVSEDAVIAEAVGRKTLSYSGILSLLHVCAAGIDMAVIDPQTRPEAIARVFRDVGVTHLIKRKALAARLIVPDRNTPRDTQGYYVFGGLLGSAPVLALEGEAS